MLDLSCGRTLDSDLPFSQSCISMSGYLLQAGHCQSLGSVCICYTEGMLLGGGVACNAHNDLKPPADGELMYSAEHLQHTDQDPSNIVVIDNSGSAN